MFKLIVKNKATGQTEQSDFKTQAECEAHKEYLKSIGYSFESFTFERPSFEEVVTPAWTEETPAEFDENGNETKPSQTINHEEVKIFHEAVVEIVGPSYSFEIVEDLKTEKLQKIKDLEQSITPRRLREAILSGNNSFIEQVEAQISEIRNNL